MGKGNRILYNLWISLEPVVVNEFGEEIAWPNSVEETGKIEDGMEAEDAAELVNEILRERGSNFRVNVPRDTLEDFGFGEGEKGC